MWIQIFQDFVRMSMTNILCVWSQVLGVLWVLKDVHCIRFQIFRHMLTFQPWRMNTLILLRLCAIYYLWGDFSRRLGPSWRWNLHPPPPCTTQYFRTIMVPLVWLHHLGQLQGRVKLLLSITSSGTMLVSEKVLWSSMWNTRSRRMMSLPNYYQHKQSSIQGSYSWDGDCGYYKSRRRTV